MRLTRFTDYALRLLMFLAHRQGIPTTIKDVAEAHGISEHHLVKVAQRLAKLGFIKTARGKSGGISPAQAAADLSIGQVVRAVESLAPAECFLPQYDGSCVLYPGCALHSALQTAQRRYLETLDAYSVAAIMGAGPPRAGRVARASPPPSRAPSRRPGPRPRRGAPK